MTRVYDDIFEAIRYILPNHPLLNLKDKCGQGTLQRNLSFEAMTMPNGKTVMLPRGGGLLLMFYRGERELYPSSYPSLYRDADEDVCLIRRLKIIDFSLIAKTFPQIYYAEKMGVNVDMLALAQHYELPTDMMDLTSDISVAAFFATTYFDSNAKCYAPMSNGEGRIRFFTFIPDADFFKCSNSPFRFVGLQPFERPGRQGAFGLQMAQGQTLESLKEISTLCFRHQKRQNQKILDLFGEQKCNELFPIELIADAADIVKRENRVTNGAVQQYCSEYGVEESEVFQVLGRHGIEVTPKPVFRLTRKQEEKLRKEFRQRPFGGAEVYSRLMYLP